MVRLIVEVEDNRVSEFKAISKSNGFEIKEDTMKVREELKFNLEKIIERDKEVFQKLAQ